MELTTSVINYIQSINISRSLNCNFLITDLEKIIYADTVNFNEYYISKPLSSDLTSLIANWNNMLMSESLCLISNNPTLKIINNDVYKQTGIIVFPIYDASNKIVGLTVFFRNWGNFIDSSAKAPNSIRKWIMKLIGNNKFEIH